jgi:hypothetical protein
VNSSPDYGYVLLSKERAIAAHQALGDYLLELFNRGDVESYRKVTRVMTARGALARELGVHGKPNVYPERILWLRNPRAFKTQEFEIPTPNDSVISLFDPEAPIPAPVVYDNRLFDRFVLARRLGANGSLGILRLATAQFQPLFGCGDQIPAQGFYFEPSQPTEEGEWGLRGFARIY